MSRRAVLVPFAVLATLATPTIAPRAQETTARLVAERGDAPPGTPAGLVLEHFGHLPSLGGADGAPPIIDAQGRVAFHAFLGDGDPSTFELAERGVWRELGGGLVAYARLGDAAPGTATVFAGFPDVFGHTPRVGAGALTVLASVNPGGGSKLGVWSDRSGALELVVLEGTALPGAPSGGELSTFAFEQRGGAIVVDARYVAPGDFDSANEGLWVDRAGTLELAAIDGMPAPGTPAGVVFGEGTLLAFFGPIDEWDANASGSVAFNGYLAGPGVDELSDEGLWSGEPGALALVARERHPVPGEPPGTLWGAGTGLEAFGDALHVPARVNAAGHLLFGADMRGVDFDHANTVWTTRSGALERVALAFSALPDNPPGDPAPGIPGGTFSQFLGGQLGDGGEILLGAAAKLGVLDERQGLWLDTGSGLQLVAAVGSPSLAVPGATVARLVAARLEPGGRVAYLADLDGPGTTPANDVVLVLARPDGTRRVLLREGQTLELGASGGDQRVIAHLVLGEGVSAQGERVAELTFTDGSIAVVAFGPKRRLPSHVPEDV